MRNLALADALAAVAADKGVTGKRSLAAQMVSLDSERAVSTR